MTKRLLSQIGKPAPPQWHCQFCRFSGTFAEVMQHVDIHEGTPVEREWAKIHAALDAWNARTGRGKARG